MPVFRKRSWTEKEIVLLTTGPLPQTSIMIRGEKMRVLKDPDLGIFIDHPVWSLIGCGQTLEEARENFVKLTTDTACAFADDLPADLERFTPEALRMREYVMKFHRDPCRHCDESREWFERSWLSRWWDSFCQELRHRPHEIWHSIKHPLPWHWKRPQRMKS